MHTDARFRINDRAATGRVIEGEAIVINVVSGRYYSLEGPGAVAWTHLSAGASLDRVVEAVLRRYDADARVVRDDVLACGERLAAEDLLVREAPDAPEPRVAEDGLPAGEHPAPYTGVSVATYRDMEDLLAFDPPLPSAERVDWR